MVKKWREWWFDGQAGDYPRSDESKKTLRQLLDVEHYKRLLRDMKEGFNSLRAGKKKKYAVPNALSVVEAHLKILQDFLKQVAPSNSAWPFCSPPAPQDLPQLLWVYYEEP